jgi:hypothetical protein
MSIERNGTSSLTPFGGAEGNEALIVQAHSAPPKGAGVLGSRSINISPQRGENRGSLHPQKTVSTLDFHFSDRLLRRIVSRHGCAQNKKGTAARALS